MASLTLPYLYPILDTALLDSHGCSALLAAEAMLDAGVQVLQWRCKDPITRARFEEAEAIAKACRKRGALFVVNDRADVAVMVGAGLHVGQDDMPPAIARDMVGDNSVLGLSTHDENQLILAAAEPVDYVAFGPVFPTSSKAKPDPVTGLEGVRTAKQMTDRPLVAIGGITRSNVLDVLDAGADSVAVISDIIPGVCTRESIRARVHEWLEVLHG